MATATFRGFVCVALPPDIKAFLGRFMADAGPSFHTDFRFVPSENLHITLQFLGDVERAMVPRLLQEIEQSIAHISPFELCLGSASAFPASGRPRVLYIGTGEGSRRLAQLARSVRRALSAMGFKEDKPFKSHITLARRKRGAGSFGALDERNAWQEAFAGRERPGLCWQVSEVLLMESTLYPTGAVYTQLGRVALPGGQ